MRGKYIIIEGLDGSGKSTLAGELLSALPRPNRRLNFPGRESDAGCLIRDVFEGKRSMNPDAMLWLFVAEGKDFEPVIQQHLNDGYNIVCDRHTMVSGLIYQGAVHGVATVDAVTHPAHFALPDRLYIVDVPPEVALERRAKRNEARNVLYESDKLEQLAAMRKQYAGMVERFPCARILDGTAGIAENVKTVLADLATLT
jgi:dTMP kinase